MSDLYERLSALSPEQRALFETRLKQRGLSIPKSQAIQRRNGPGPHALSIDQEQLWVVNQLDPGNAAYNVHSAMSLTGPLDVAALERTIREIISRHEMLRTTFQAVGGRPVQVITQDFSLPLGVTDVSGQANAPEEAIRLADEEIRRPFDLAAGPLLRVRLLRVGDEEHVLVVVMHHIVADSWSFGVFNQELWALYGAFSEGGPPPLAELPIQYADFAAWQREWLTGDVLEEKLSYWKKRLAGAPSILNLPTDRPRPAAQTYRGATRLLTIPEGTAKALKELAHRERATMFMTMLAAFDVLLFRYSGQSDIVVGSPIANRNRPEIQNLIGYFLNMLMLRATVDDNTTFRGLLAQVRDAALEAYAHQDIPFARLVQELQPERDMAQNPLFQVAFVYLDFQEQDMELRGLKTRALKLDSGTSMFDLTLGLTETQNGLEASFEYSMELFDAATIDRMTEHFKTLLESIVANPGGCLWEVPMMSERERRQAVSHGRPPAPAHPAGLCLHHLVERQARLRPGRRAVSSGGRAISYGELNARANRLANYLRRRGAGPERVVGVMVSRGEEAVVALLGVLKSGSGYLPLEAGYPRERLGYMLADSGAGLVVGEGRLVGGLAAGGVEVVKLDEESGEIEKESGEDVAGGASAENVAYVIYTSGSTGRPKG
ncbi:MAG: condensation domain-containing protein, partial [Blastocatellia bacterium]